MKASIYQKRFWLEWQLDPSSTKYHESFLHHLQGKLDINLLKQAFGALAQKHPLLRCCFFEQGADLHIKIIENFELPFEVIDITNDQAESISITASQISNVSFDFKKGPLWLAKLLRLNEQQAWLVVIFRHIIIDGNSFDMFRSDIARFYNQKDAIKKLSDIEQYKLDLKEYLEINNEKNTDSIFDAQSKLNYYKEKLVSKTLKYDINTSLDEKEILFFPLGNQAFKKVEKFCLKNNYKPFRFMAAIFAIFLFQYFGQEEFCAVYPVNMRHKSKKEVLGSFINLQLLPLVINQKSSFEEIFAQVCQNREATRTLTIPYEKIIDYLKQENVIAPIDLANIVISETDLKLKSINLNGLHTTSIWLPKPSLPYDISFEYECIDGNIYVQLSFKNHWFNDKYHAKQIQKHLKYIINFVSKYPQITLDRMLLVSAMRLDTMKKMSNAQWPLLSINNQRIENKFGQIVRQHPDRIAIIELDKKTTYLQLAQMAETIASNLTTKLNKTTKFVGISMQHCAELVATIIALFKLEKAYIPIRPDLPAAYVDEIINQSGLNFIIADKIPNYISEHLVVYPIKDLLNEATVKNLSVENCDVNDLAYVLYTSGTTGIPKGVLINHASIVNLISSCQFFYHISINDVIPWFHSYGFDFSVWEIWSALLNGAGLLILEEHTIKSPRGFTRAIAQYGATFINKTPTALKQWITYLTESNHRLSDLSSIRAIVAGGEALYPMHVENLLLNKTPLRCRIFNMYGITEDCVHSTIFEIKMDYLKQQHSIVGKMLPGKYGLVVDEYNNLKPVGCPGELLIAGFGVAQGYLNQPKITQERFIRLPDSEETWFKTGDQVRLLPSGDLEYIGRKDTQIKIRGYRIDCKDIEVRLMQLSGVIDAKVIANAGELLAFFILGSSLVNLNISIMAKAKLPFYMMPSKFIRVNELPRTINGKIDEKKLLELGGEVQETVQSILQINSSSTLLQVAEVWKSLLPNKHFGFCDNFFDCGGNSILLVALQRKLEKLFSIELPIVKFFSHPTIIDIAKIVEQYADE